MSTICSACGCPVDELSGVCPVCGNIESGSASNDAGMYEDPFLQAASGEEQYSEPEPIPEAPPAPPVNRTPVQSQTPKAPAAPVRTTPTPPAEPARSVPKTSPLADQYPKKKQKRKLSCWGCGCLAVVALVVVFALLVGAGFLLELAEQNEDQNPSSSAGGQSSFFEDSFSFADDQPEQTQPVTLGQFSLDNLPAGAVEFNGHYYYIYTAEVVSYDEAMAFCQSRGGYLATVTSAEENQFLHEYMTSQNFDRVYLGATDAAEEGNWVWSNGEAFSYTNWNAGEPNNDLDGEDEMAMYRVLENGAWNDIAFATPTFSTVQPTVAALSASSELVGSSSGKLYAVEWLYDGELNTAWNEGVDGTVGESVTMYFDQPYRITGFEIRAGFQSNEEVYYKNARPKLVELRYSDGSSETYHLEDVFGVQYITLNQPVSTDYVTMTILEAYSGNTWEDNCITELRYTAETSAIGFVCEWGEYIPEN